MKVLFLDIDGVLVLSTPGQFHSNLVVNLRKIIEATGAKIVLSTDWRRTSEGLREVKRQLNMQGMDYIAKTRPSRSMWCAERAQEIADWIRDHNRRNVGGDMVTSYVAIDDRVLTGELGGEYMRGHFVQTRMSSGLNQERSQQAINILNGHPTPNDLLATPLDTDYRSTPARPHQPHQRPASASTIGRGTGPLPRGGVASSQTRLTPGRGYPTREAYQTLKTALADIDTDYIIHRSPVTQGRGPREDPASDSRLYEASSTAYEPSYYRSPSERYATGGEMYPSAPGTSPFAHRRPLAIPSHSSYSSGHAAVSSSVSARYAHENTQGYREASAKPTRSPGASSRWSPSQSYVYR